jgi:hypothetical protein
MSRIRRISFAREESWHLAGDFDFCDSIPIHGEVARSAGCRIAADAPGLEICFTVALTYDGFD